MRDATRVGLGVILAEMADHSKCRITIDEERIPLRQEVRGLCEILGLDPFSLANEGKIAVFCSEIDADRILEVMKRHEYGKDAAVDGRVLGKNQGRLVLNTVIGGAREVDLPAGELVPRIC
jgi:hydrogenase expression/formation protein HypE